MIMYQRFLLCLSLLFFTTTGLIFERAVAVNKNAMPVNEAAVAFISYLQDIDRLVRPQGCKETYLILERVTKQFIEIEELFDLGAFSNIPLFRNKFYEIFKNINKKTWPTAAEVRAWGKNIGNFKKFLRIPIVSFGVQGNDTNYKLMLVLESLLNELLDYVFVDNFFEFSFLEKLNDFFIDRPINFSKEHPYLAVGIVVTAIVVGSGMYYYLTRESELEKWLKEHDAELILGSQKAADCGAKALYAAWCRHAANDNAERYKELFIDEKRYGRFKERITRYLNAAEELKPLRHRRKKTANWLENDDVQALLGQLHAAAGEGDEFGFEVNDDDLMFIRSQADIREEMIDGGDVRYRDRELVTRDGDPLVYSPDTLPADRVAFCDEYRAGGLRDQLRARINRFRRKAGNKIDFIINTNIDDVRDYEAVKAGRRYNPANRGHFFHIRAINDPEAEEGTHIQITETFDPDVKEISDIVENLRHFLRPI